MRKLSKFLLLQQNYWQKTKNPKNRKIGTRKAQISRNRKVEKRKIAEKSKYRKTEKLRNPKKFKIEKNDSVKARIIEMPKI